MSGAELFVTVAAVVGVGYLLDVLIFWRVRCRWCAGSGSWRSPFTRAERDCPRCHGDKRHARWEFLRRR